jgi:hypothetical protein
MAVDFRSGNVIAGFARQSDLRASGTLRYDMLLGKHVDVIASKLVHAQRTPDHTSFPDQYG